MGAIWVATGEMQNALDAAALAGANTVSIQLEIDKYGTIYSQRLVADPYRADSDARSTLQANVAHSGVSVTSVTVTLAGTKVTVSSTFSVPTSLLAAFSGVPPRVSLTRSASADCAALPIP